MTELEALCSEDEAAWQQLRADPSYQLRRSERKAASFRRRETVELNNRVRAEQSEFDQRMKLQRSRGDAPQRLLRGVVATAAAKAAQRKAQPPPAPNAFAGFPQFQNVPVAPVRGNDPDYIDNGTDVMLQFGPLNERQKALAERSLGKHFGISAYTGIARLERCAVAQNLMPVGIIEKDVFDRSFAQRLLRLPDQLVCGDILQKEWELWRFSYELLFLLACSPCRIVSGLGKELGLDDPEAEVTVSAWADVADRFLIPFITGEQHIKVATLRGGEVLKAIDARQRVGRRLRTPLVEGAPLGAECVADTRHAEVRNRIGLHFEHERTVGMLSPCPLLDFGDDDLGPPAVIADVLLPAAEIADSLYVDGDITIFDVSPPFSRSQPTIAGELIFGGPGKPLIEGVHVKRVIDGIVTEPMLVLYELRPYNKADLFYDNSQQPTWLRQMPLAELRPFPRTLRLHHINGVASPATDFGVPPLWEDKQLILVNGRARRFDERELYALGGDADGPALLKSLAPDMTASQRRRRHGKSLSMNLANALAARLRRRCDEFVDVRRGQLARFSQRPESLIVAWLVNLAFAAVVVVFLHIASADSEPLALVDSNDERLPGLVYDNISHFGEISHRTAVNAVQPVLDVFRQSDEANAAVASTAFFADEHTDDSGNTCLVVCCTVDHVHPNANHPSMKWLPLTKVRQRTPRLNKPVMLVMAALLAQQAQRCLPLPVSPPIRAVVAWEAEGMPRPPQGRGQAPPSQRVGLRVPQTTNPSNALVGVCRASVSVCTTTRRVCGRTTHALPGFPSGARHTLPHTLTVAIPPIRALASDLSNPIVRETAEDWSWDSPPVGMPVPSHTPVPRPSVSACLSIREPASGQGHAPPVSPISVWASRVIVIVSLTGSWVANRSLLREEPRDSPLRSQGPWASPLRSDSLPRRAGQGSFPPIAGSGDFRQRRPHLHSPPLPRTVLCMPTASQRSCQLEPHDANVLS